ncbi:MAG: ADP-ribosylglycohydrolase family protein [Dehalococcoidia bacterium]
MPLQQLRAKFRGALLGVAVGDALGAPFEGAGAIDERYLRRLEREPGQLHYTDDTHMTLGMAESLVERRGFDGTHMAALFARNFGAQPWRGYGAGPPQVFRLIEQGVPWDQASRALFGGSGSFGNGAAMRVAPAALLGFRNLEQVAWLARQTGVITHAHELGLEGAVLQASAIALLLQHPSDIPLDCHAFLDALRVHMGTALYLQKLDRIQALLPVSPREEVIAELGNGIAAYEAVPTAIYAFLRHPGSFPKMVTYAISLGGDTDTIASMAGALAGAHLGEQAIPPVWREQVEGAARLRELADALLLLATGEASSVVEGA